MPGSVTEQAAAASPLTPSPRRHRRQPQSESRKQNATARGRGQLFPASVLSSCQRGAVAFGRVNVLLSWALSPLLVKWVSRGAVRGTNEMVNT